MVVTVVNLGGEGEVRGAIDVNALIEENMVNRNFVARGRPLIWSFAHQIALGDGSVDRVVANRFPIQHNQAVASRGGGLVSMKVVVAEIHRILKPGGDVSFSCSSCDRGALMEYFAGSGFLSLEVNNGYIEGRRP